FRAYGPLDEEQLDARARGWRRRLGASSGEEYDRRRDFREHRSVDYSGAAGPSGDGSPFAA
ncbi:MAG: hypothetical protein ABIO65_02090, partial [Nitrospiria bacterium]